MDNQESIAAGTIGREEFIKRMPVVTVEVYLKPETTEGYFVKDLSYSIEDGQIVYGLRYEYKPSKVENIYSTVKSVLTSETLDEKSIAAVKLNLLPTEEELRKEIENQKAMFYL